MIPRFDRPICDFCPGGQRPAFVYPCRNILQALATPAVPGRIELASWTGDWWACRHCAQLLEHADWRGLADRYWRVLAFHGYGRPAGAVRAGAEVDMVASWRLFTTHRLPGPPAPAELVPWRPRRAA